MEWFVTISLSLKLFVCFSMWSEEDKQYYQNFKNNVLLEEDDCWHVFKNLLILERVLERVFKASYEITTLTLCWPFFRSSSKFLEVSNVSLEYQNTFLCVQSLEYQNQNLILNSKFKFMVLDIWKHVRVLNYYFIHCYPHNIIEIGLKSHFGSTKVGTQNWWVKVWSLRLVVLHHRLCSNDLWILSFGGAPTCYLLFFDGYVNGYCLDYLEGKK